MRRLALAPVAALLAAAALADSSLPGPPAQLDAGVDEKIRNLWRSLPSSRSGCRDFDYFPDGGMRNFHCHLLPQIAFGAFEKLVGFPIFLRGPHGKQGKLDLTSTRSFGHYNPRFVRWLPALVPSLRDVRFRSVAQPIYDRYVRPLARVHHRVYRKLQSDPAFLAREKAQLLKEMTSASGATDTYERFFDYAPEVGDGNVAKTVVAFWIRRSIDGTDGDFIDALEQLLRVHDPTLLQR